MPRVPENIRFYMHPVAESPTNYDMLAHVFCQKKTPSCIIFTTKRHPVDWHILSVQAWECPPPGKLFIFLACTVSPSLPLPPWWCHRLHVGYALSDVSWWQPTELPFYLSIFLVAPCILLVQCSVPEIKVLVFCFSYLFNFVQLHHTQQEYFLLSVNTTFYMGLLPNSQVFLARRCSMLS